MCGGGAGTRRISEKYKEIDACLCPPGGRFVKQTSTMVWSYVVAGVAFGFKMAIRNAM
jgi:hypothetical protein